MALYSLTSSIELSSPVLISAFAGWVDAASVATSAAQHIGGSGETIATFDSDELFVYRTNRPFVEIANATIKDIAWPEVLVRHSRLHGRDVLLLTGVEPDLRWKEFAVSVLELALRLGVTELISLGAISAAVPHTLAPPVLATASRSELLDEAERRPEGLLRVPGAAVNVVDQQLARHGLATMGFWAQIPHYVTSPYSPGVAALVERVARHLDVEIPVGALEEQGRAQRRHLDEIVAARPEAKAYVERLEGVAAQQQIPSGDEMAAEIERFLKEAAGGDQSPFDEDGPGAQGPLP